MKKVIRFLISCRFLILISFLASLLLNSSLEDRFVIQFGLNQSFFIFDVISLFTFCIYIARDNERLIFKSRDLYIFLVLLFYLLSALCFSIVNSISEPVIKMYYCLDFILWGFLLMFVKYRAEDLKIIIKILLFAYFYLCIQTFILAFGFVQYDQDASAQVGNLLRASTTAGTENLSSYLIYLLMILLYFYYEKLKYYILIIGGLSIFLTLCRGGILVYSAFVCCVLIKELWYKALMKKVIYTVVIMTVGISLNSVFHFNKVLKAREEVSESYSDGDYSAGRFDRWNDLFKRLDTKNSYLFGLGIGVTPMHRSEISNDKGWIQFSPHNVYLGILGETGVLSLLLFIILLISVLVRLYKIDILLFCGLLSFVLIGYNTEIVTYTYFFSLLIWFMFYNIDSISYLRKKDELLKN